MKKTIIGFVILWLAMVVMGLLMGVMMFLATVPDWWVVPVVIVTWPAVGMFLAWVTWWAMCKFVVEEL